MVVGKILNEEETRNYSNYHYLLLLVKKLHMEYSIELCKAFSNFLCRQIYNSSHLTPQVS